MKMEKSMTTSPRNILRRASIGLATASIMLVGCITEPLDDSQEAPPPGDSELRAGDRQDGQPNNAGPGCNPADHDKIGISYKDVGNGSETVPYRIYNAFQLISMSKAGQDMSKHYEQCADIDMNDLTMFGAPERRFTIGWNANPFTGSYDGNGFAIKNFTNNITSPLFAGSDESQVGLFGYIAHAELSNISLVDATVSAPEGWSIGTLVGHMEASTVHNCHSSGSVEGIGDVGGLVGHAIAKSLIVESSAATHVKFYDYRAGGLVGVLNASTVMKSSASGDVFGVDDGDNGGAGGFVGDTFDHSSIANCFATGDVSGFAGVGGFGSSMQKTHILNSYATGDVRGYLSVGGFASFLDASFLANVYATGNVVGEWDYVGGFVGAVQNSTIANGYATGDVTGIYQTQVGGFAGLMQGGTISNVFTLSQSIQGQADVGVFAALDKGGSTVTNAYYWSKVACVNNNCNTAFATPESKKSRFFSKNNAPLDMWDFVNIWEEIPGTTPVLKQ
ncbi:MAG: hypothetical protein IPL79_01000 [Myxococcales bacterium]|nr:hypothetical protein [Myxococcales bacterium]